MASSDGQVAWNAAPGGTRHSLLFAPGHGGGVLPLVRTGIGAASHCRLSGGAAHETIDSTLLPKVAAELGRRIRLHGAG